LNVMAERHNCDRSRIFVDVVGAWRNFKWQFNRSLFRKN